MRIVLLLVVLAVIIAISSSSAWVIMARLTSGIQTEQTHTLTHPYAAVLPDPAAAGN